MHDTGMPVSAMADLFQRQGSKEVLTIFHEFVGPMFRWSEVI